MRRKLSPDNAYYVNNIPYQKETTKFNTTKLNVCIIYREEELSRQ